MAAAGKLLSSVSHIAGKAKDPLEAANSAKELLGVGKKETGESDSAAPAGSPSDNAIQQLLQSVMKALSGGSNS